MVGLKSAVTPSTEPLLELFYRAVSDEGAEVRSNAAYAIGLLVEHSQVDLSPQYLPLLAALRPLFVDNTASADELNARDNATGAVARLITRNAAAMPLDQVLPVFIEALPLRKDFAENRPAFGALFHIFRISPQQLHPYMDRLLHVFAHVLNPANTQPQIDDEVRGQLISLIGALNAEDPVKIQAAGLAPFIHGA
jgi:hypothetical protein